MYTINVTKVFSLRVGPGVPKREFSKGEHTISEEERAHWFMAACIKDGRARLVEGVPAPGQPDYAAMTVVELKAMAKERGLNDVPANANKAALVELLLAASASAAKGQENAGGGE